ncbi:Transmembrane emp24 domain-containing protein 4 [Portunus trituberculatus]|uniref:Transmembrane emp24 domain-containing protein 4 n=1 Tax=Portunus trituberculatus TaxID=210409 RepID=A0A5B7JIE5_PORTR|nr:Transmembrane emp24 domain-containing protein 4 [Portunus trituberculatus]
METISRLTLSFLLLLVNVLAGVDGLYFHIGETERKCFIEEIPDETMVTGECGKQGPGSVRLRDGRTECEA